MCILTNNSNTGKNMMRYFGLRGPSKFQICLFEVPIFQSQADIPLGFTITSVISKPCYFERPCPMGPSIQMHDATRPLAMAGLVFVTHGEDINDIISHHYMVEHGKQVLSTDIMIKRQLHTVAWRYEFNFWVVKMIKMSTAYCSKFRAVGSESHICHTQPYTGLHGPMWGFLGRIYMVYIILDTIL